MKDAKFATSLALILHCSICVSYLGYIRIRSQDFSAYIVWRIVIPILEYLATTTGITNSALFMTMKGVGPVSIYSIGEKRP